MISKSERTLSFNTGLGTTYAFIIMKYEVNVQRERRKVMELILIILVLFLIFGGGGFYWSRRGR
jgi:hypothetical protein